MVGTVKINRGPIKKAALNQGGFLKESEGINKVHAVDYA
jgi:hypothetical protein